MFENFRLEMINVPETTLRVRHGGKGPPLLLLHGHPRTHTTWYKVVPILADKFTVVCPHLRGFGKSGKPSDPYDHEASSKRAKARDNGGTGSFLLNTTNPSGPSLPIPWHGMAGARLRWEKKTSRTSARPSKTPGLFRACWVIIARVCT